MVRDELPWEDNSPLTQRGGLIKSPSRSSIRHEDLRSMKDAAGSPTGRPEPDQPTVPDKPLVTDEVESGDVQTTGEPMESRGCRRYLYLLVAGFFFVLGFLGALLPGLPATPFLLLTSYFLVRSSPKLNERLLNSKFIGPILVDWQVHGGVTPQVKRRAILIVVIAVGLTLYLTGESWRTGMVVVVLAAIGVFVIWRLPVVSRKG